MRLAKWGNSLAIRLPTALVEELELKAGDEVEIYIAGQRSFELAKVPGRLELLQRLRKYRGFIPADFKFDRDEAHERGPSLRRKP